MSRTIAYLKASVAGLRSRDFYILLSLFAICTLIYYFGELVDFVGWQGLRWEFFYSVHDTQRLFFLAPIIYAGYFFKTKGAIVSTIASLIVFLPRAIFVSSFPDAITRAVLFAILAGIVGFIFGKMRNKLQQYRTGKMLKGIGHGLFIAGDLEVDLSRRITKRHGQIVKLTRNEYELLSCLIQNSGKVMTHKDLLRNVWGPEYGQEVEYLRTFIRQLRRKIEDDPSNPKFIVTESGFGYRFVEPE